MDVDERLTRVLAEVLDVPADQIGDDTSMETTEQWDSMASMMLIPALEEEFHIRLSDKEVMQLTSYLLIKEVLAGKKIS